MQRRIITALAALAIAAPALGVAINLAWPPEHYGYERELVVLVGIWLVSFGVAGNWPRGAVVLYCAAALVPVGMMLQYYHGIGGGFSVLTLTPPTGVAVVAILTRDERATIGYGLVAIVASLAFGSLTDDLGQGGALAFFSGVLTACMLWLVQNYNLKTQLMEIGDRQENIDRGLKKITGELGK